MAHQRKVQNKSNAVTPPNKKKARLASSDDATSGDIAASTSRHPVSAGASIISAGRRKQNRDDSYEMVVPQTIGEVDATAATIADVHLRIAKSTGGFLT